MQIFTVRASGPGSATKLSMVVISLFEATKAALHRSICKGNADRKVRTVMDAETGTVIGSGLDWLFFFSVRPAAQKRPPRPSYTSDWTD